MSANSSGQFSFTPPDGDGTYYFAISAKDNEDNDTGEPASAMEQTIYDTTAPSVDSFSVPTFSSNTIYLTFQASDTGGSGIFGSEFYYIPDPYDRTKDIYLGYTLQSSGTVSVTTASIPITSDGTAYFSVYSIDNAGNASQEAYCGTYVDQTPPIAPTNVIMDHVIPTSGWIHATWNASTDTSGIYCYAYQFWYKDSGGVKHNLEDLTGTYAQEAYYEFGGEYENGGMPYLSSTSAKTYGVTVYAIDNAMNWSSDVDSNEVQCKKVKVGFSWGWCLTTDYDYRGEVHDFLSSTANANIEYHQEMDCTPSIGHSVSSI